MVMIDLNLVPVQVALTDTDNVEITDFPRQPVLSRNLNEDGPLSLEFSFRGHTEALVNGITMYVHGHKWMSQVMDHPVRLDEGDTELIVTLNIESGVHDRLNNTLGLFWDT